MALQLKHDLEHLKGEILSMGAMVEDAINKAIHAFLQRRPDLTREVLEGDGQIDAKENAIEEQCLKTLALHQPVAKDLRFIVTVLKVNNDLERMGDMALNIAERTAFLASTAPLPVPAQFAKMLSRVSNMVRESLDALVNGDTGLARRVRLEDDEVDATNREMFIVLQDLMRRQPDMVERAVHTLSISRNLERIADLATNIAEDVVFMVEGEVIRHRFKGYSEDDAPGSAGGS